MTRRKRFTNKPYDSIPIIPRLTSILGMRLRSSAAHGGARLLRHCPVAEAAIGDSSLEPIARSPAKRRFRSRMGGIRLKALAQGRQRSRTFPEPAWDGSSLDGRRVLVYSEQGLGDAVQFVRYAGLLQKAGAYVLFEAPTPLAPFFLMPADRSAHHRRGAVAGI